eukprot:scaffold1297_cov368-Prasinococcus_capsulatus_cf.AAC.5
MLLRRADQCGSCCGAGDHHPVQGQVASASGLRRPASGGGLRSRIQEEVDVQSKRKLSEVEREGRDGGAK